jgi:hypothetical protein
VKLLYLENARSLKQEEIARKPIGFLHCAISQESSANFSNRHEPKPKNLIRVFRVHSRLIFLICAICEICGACHGATRT